MMIKLEQDQHFYDLSHHVNDTTYAFSMGWTIYQSNNKPHSYIPIVGLVVLKDCDLRSTTCEWIFYYND